jgi:methyl-accepting chemotaxis protein WspA
MRWTIGRQIFAGYGISLLFLIALGALAYKVSEDMLRTFDQRQEAELILDHTDTVLSLVQDVETGQRGFVITGADNFLEPYNAAVDRLPQDLANFKQQLMVGKRDLSYWDELQSHIQAKLSHAEKTIALRRTTSLEAAEQLVSSGEGKRQMDAIRKIMGVIKQNEATILKNSDEETQKEVLRFKLVLLVGLLLCITLMLVIGLYTARSIAHPINEIAGAATQIAAGNLDVGVAPKSLAAEVNVLSKAFTRMLVALRQSAGLSEQIAAGDLTVEIIPQSDGDVVGRAQKQMVQGLSALVEQLQRSGVQVNSSAVQIAATGKQQQSTASEMASTTTEISATAKEMSATSTELLKAADNVNAVTQQVTGLAANGKEGLVRMGSIMRQIMEASTSITARLGEMNEKAGNISGVVTTITKVADQTNLLSLNAAIEAEKAGEYGRGFSVVASEIRRLADQTAASTLDIEQLVKDMLGSVSAGVMGMDKFSEEVRRSAKEVSDVSRQIDKMIEQVQSLAPSIESVYEGMRAQTQGASQISDALVQLGDAARQTADAVRDSNRSVDQLNDATKGLQSAISGFKLR